MYSKVVNFWDIRGTIYTDQTGKFPDKARSGSKHIMLMVAININAVLLVPTKNETDKEQRLAYLALLNQQKQAGFEVKKHLLDNECSNNMKELINSECMLELAPLDATENMAKVGITLFKTHFMLILSDVDDSFPMQLWDKLLS